MGVNCRCFDTLRTTRKHNPLSSNHKIVFLLFQFQEDGRDKENKVLGGKGNSKSESKGEGEGKGGGEGKFSENNKPLTVLAWVDG